MITGEGTLKLAREDQANEENIKGHQGEVPENGRSRQLGAAGRCRAEPAASYLENAKKLDDEPMQQNPSDANVPNDGPTSASKKKKRKEATVSGTSTSTSKGKSAKTAKTSRGRGGKTKWFQ
ncbi:hypothetical protein OROHE_012718 [Orobanche hederae]